MTESLALEYVARRMCELGYGNHYSIRYRHLILQPSEVRLISAFSQLFLITGNPANIRVESNLAFYEMNVNRINELQYEHTGELIISNLSDSAVTDVKFIQVIPQKCMPCG